MEEATIKGRVISASSNKYTVDLGEKIAPPYIFDAKDSLKDGENDVEILLTTTLGLSKRDKFTHFSAIEKYGLTKNLKVIEYTK